MYSVKYTIIVNILIVTLIKCLINTGNIYQSSNIYFSELMKIIIPLSTTLALCQCSTSIITLNKGKAPEN